MRPPLDTPIEIEDLDPIEAIPLPKATERTLWLNLSRSNDFVWTTTESPKKQSCFSKLMECFPFGRFFRETLPAPSPLDFTVKDNMKVHLKIGSSLPNWRYWDRDFAQNHPVWGQYRRIDMNRAVGGTTHGNGEGIFIMHTRPGTDMRNLSFTHLKSNRATSSRPTGPNPDGAFIFKLYLTNFIDDGSGNTKVTPVIIDPIIMNDGKGLRP